MWVGSMGFSATFVTAIDVREKAFIRHTRARKGRVGDKKSGARAPRRTVADAIADVVSMAENLPDLERGDLVYSVNIGAYSHVSATWFNGFPPAKVVHEGFRSAKT